MMFIHVHCPFLNKKQTYKAWLQQEITKLVSLSLVKEITNVNVIKLEIDTLYQFISVSSTDDARNRIATGTASEVDCISEVGLGALASFTFALPQISKY